ncbi:MAG: hypothetical protein A2Z99_04085 [Treponema sp. GWB1_62_6]|nr:MAG: hypothetical protein A2Y36_15195 [Treponema sp. GWA1_62_8]OHE65060.1 MAG: hypothetical protein A2001_17810 [Treponema sp. GWC1_61_84]OHE71492.1 MAG: hypothetical protein A2Z99_04085 [Treponema sp. GWB1_62_6]HCM26045.1 TIGR03960 family B12-binding radical SAM protein [Treponema sp.]
MIPDKRTVDPVRDLGAFLMNAEKPARYIGGEYGEIRKETAALSIAIAFPDLYEIGMSNTALRILYNRLNAIHGLRCERVFAPAPDFEAILRERGVPLFSLESGIVLSEFDIIAVTFGYELGITGLLSILSAGGVPILNTDRSPTDPIVMMGGPACSNPAPYSRFVDAFWIGEAEAGFFDLMAESKNMKERGAGRSEILAFISSSRHVWIPGKKAVRAVHADFGKADEARNIFPIPNIKVIQDHGVVEIMRGCPNGCRFCHAGVWYRPMRQKSADLVIAEVRSLVEVGGYREISFSSLSSGDYNHIFELISYCTARYKSRNVSFQLPSLKISSFFLPLLDSLSEVRRSGLTFAVETPVDAWQLAINKEVAYANVVSILKEAKLRGWSQAKFYFMIGLPVETEGSTEEDRIVDFLASVSRETKMKINANIGSFIPKPHTPYQWIRQIGEGESARKMNSIRHSLERYNIKVSTHDPFTSAVEGIMSRGGADVSGIIEDAFVSGARLDAWNELFRPELWRESIASHAEAAASALGEKPTNAKLPWHEINPGVSESFLRKEYELSKAQLMTDRCSDDCSHKCGSCNDESSLVSNQSLCEDDAASAPAFDLPSLPEDGSTAPDSVSRIERETYRMVLSFAKTGKSVFLPHLGLMELFCKAFNRTDLPIKYTEGFNPLPKLDFASPLSLGIASLEEIATVDLYDAVTAERFVESMNRALPTFIRVTRAERYLIPVGTKKHSAASMLWGHSYRTAQGDRPVASSQEKGFRAEIIGDDEGRKLDILIVSTLARGDEGTEGISYFTAYSNLYGI